MPLPFQQGFMVPPAPRMVSASSVLWDTSTKHADVTLSGTDNLIATLTGGAGGAYRTTRANTAIVNGSKKFFEITVNTKGSASGFAIGACLSGQSATAYIGNAASTGASMSGNGNLFINGSAPGSDGGGYSASQTVLVILNRVLDRMWWYTASQGYRGAIGGSDDPTTDTGGLDISAITADMFPAVSLFTLNDQVTANFGHSAFVNTTQVSALITAGFSALGT